MSFTVYEVKVEILSEVGIKHRRLFKMAAASTSSEKLNSCVKTDVFLSHDWGEDGITNHKKVEKINEAIKGLGYVTWFDNERMVGNVREQMANGIENTKCFIAFITKRYHNKVVFGTDRDNCRVEFDFASMKVPMVAVLLDPSMKNPHDWKGNLGLTLATKLYIDLSGDINDEKYLTNQLKLLEKDLTSKRIFPNKLEETTNELKVLDIREEDNPLSKNAVENQETIPDESIEKMKRKANNLRGNGKWAEAIPLCENIIKKQTFTLGENHKDTLKTRYWLARCYYQQKDYQKAIPIFQDVGEKQTSTLGENHVDTLNTRYMLALCYYQQKDYQKAIPIFQDVGEKRTTTSGENDEDTLKTRYWLARCYYQQKDYQKAIPIFQDVGEKRTFTLGENHVDTLNTRYWLALCYYDQNDYRKAIPIFQDVGEKETFTLGENHVDTLNTRYMLALCYYEQNDYQKAIQIFQDVGEKRTFTLGENHQNTLNTRYWLAHCYYDQNDYRKAILILEDVFRRQTSTFGENHEDTVRSKELLKACNELIN
uniref:TIR domain-containing protein n=1 Tax=Clytia hemisphaerica TaxID=252671 RepID=A0A7M5XIQ0_9CNID